MPGRSDPLSSRLGSLTARELLAARLRAKRAMGDHPKGRMAARLVEQIDTELERRRARKLGTQPVPDAHDRWEKLLAASGADPAAGQTEEEPA
ncbi:MAG: hypothetical protein ACFB6R_09525 [Alphaproteobacteria bacterium]